MNILTGLKELWLRFKNSKDLPLFFNRFRAVALFLIGLGSVMTAKPEWDFVMWVFYEGKAHEKVYYWSMFFNQVGAGIAFASQLTLNESAKREMQRKLNTPQ